MIAESLVLPSPKISPAENSLSKSFADKPKFSRSKVGWYCLLSLTGFVSVKERRQYQPTLDLENFG